MGWLRLFLAVSVVAYHFHDQWPWALISGATAVRCFFVISGYTIALVLEQRYAGRLGAFYKARALRIYPAYFAVVLLSLAWWGWLYEYSGIKADVVKVWAEASPGAAKAVPLLASQFSLFGIDWEELWSPTPGMLMSRYMVLQHAWSLSVELVFYAMAPWLCKAPSRILWALLVLSIATHLLLSGSGALIPRIAPGELGFFALGVLAWRHSRERVFAPQRALIEALAFVAALLSVPYLGLSEGAATVLASLLTGLGIPALRELGRSSRLDRRLGDISYSIYLVHPTIGYMLVPFLNAGLLPLPRYGLLPASLLAGAVIWALVDRPLRRSTGNP